MPKMPNSMRLYAAQVFSNYRLDAKSLLVLIRIEISLQIPFNYAKTLPFDLFQPPVYGFDDLVNLLSCDA